MAAATTAALRREVWGKGEGRVAERRRKGREKEEEEEIKMDGRNRIGGEGWRKNEEDQGGKEGAEGEEGKVGKGKERRKRG